MPTNRPERWELQQVYERWQADEAERQRGRKAEGEVGRLAQYILSNVPGEPSQNESAVDTACRLLERGREALSIIENWRPQHADDCTVRCGICNCGLAKTLAQLRGEIPPDPQSSATATVNPEPRKPAEWEYDVPGDTVAPWEHDVDAFNREQRARREAYAQGLVDGDIASRKGDVPNEFCRADAAKRYPLKKREPRIIPDPHGAGEWQVHADGDGFEFREDGERVSWSAPENEDNALLWTPDRIRALAELLDSPWAWVDDTTPEH